MPYHLGMFAYMGLIGRANALIKYHCYQIGPDQSSFRGDFIKRAFSIQPWQLPPEVNRENPTEVIE